jgi:hypothetical protein
MACWCSIIDGTSSTLHTDGEHIPPKPASLARPGRSLIWDPLRHYLRSKLLLRLVIIFIFTLSTTSHHEGRLFVRVIRAQLWLAKCENKEFRTCPWQNTLYTFDKYNTLKELKYKFRLFRPSSLVKRIPCVLIFQSFIEYFSPRTFTLVFQSHWILVILGKKLLTLELIAKI